MRIEPVGDLVLEPALIVDLDPGADLEPGAPRLPRLRNGAHIGVVVEVVHHRVFGVEVLVFGETDLVQPDLDGALALRIDGGLAVVGAQGVYLIVYCIIAFDHGASLLFLKQAQDDRSYQAGRVDRERALPDTPQQTCYALRSSERLMAWAPISCTICAQVSR